MRKHDVDFQVSVEPNQVVVFADLVEVGKITHLNTYQADTIGRLIGLVIKEDTSKDANELKNKLATYMRYLDSDSDMKEGRS